MATTRSIAPPPNLLKSRYRPNRRAAPAAQSTWSRRHDPSRWGIGRLHYKLLRIDNADGSKVYLNYDSQFNQVTSIEGTPPGVAKGSGYTYSLGYDANGMLDSIGRPDNHSTSFAYYSGGLLTTLTDFLGQDHTFTYDSLGLLKSDDAPGSGGTLTLSNQNVDGNYDVSISTSEGLTTHYTIIDPQKELYSREIDEPNGGHITVSHDADGTRHITRSDGTQETLQWSKDPRPAYADFNRYMSHYEEATPGGLTRQLDNAVAYTDDGTGGIADWTETTTSHRGASSYNWLRVFSATSSVGDYEWSDTTPEGRTTTYHYDAQGRLVQVDHPYGDKTRFVYGTTSEQLEQIIHEDIFGNQRTTQITYDASGRIDQSTQTVGGQQQTTDFVSYDGLGQPTEINEPGLDGSTVRNIQFSRNGAGSKTSLVVPDRDNDGSRTEETHTFSYDNAGRLDTYTPPDLATGSTPTAYGYDLDGKLKTIDVPGPDKIIRTYNSTSGQLEQASSSRFLRSYAYYGGTNHLRTSPCIAAPRLSLRSITSGTGRCSSRFPQPMSTLRR